MSDSFEVVPDDLTGHASTLDGLAGQLNAALATAKGVDLTPDAFGEVGQGFVPDVQSLATTGQDALRTQVASLETATTDMRTTVSNYQQQDTDTGTKLAALGNDLPQQPTAPQAATVPDTSTVAQAPAADPPPAPPASVPPPGSDPSDVKKYWDGLTQEQKQQVAQEQPERIGALDGVPAAARDYANRINLDNLMAEQQQKLNDLNRNPPSPTTIFEDNDSKINAYGAWQQQVDETQTKLGGLDQIQKLIGDKPPFPTSDIPGTANDSPGDSLLPNAPADAPALTTKYLLGVDTDGPGHAIIASNNPDAAANVATVIPGAETRLQAGEVYGNVLQADRLVAAATNAGSPSTSVISWMNYDAPPGTVSALASGPAADAAPALNQFEQGLNATNGSPGTVHSTLVGYSYGSVVVGQAATAAGGLGNVHVDDVVALGSPGMDVPTASALGVPPGPPDQPHVWAARGSNDWVGISPTHLADPTSPSFGANVINAGDAYHGSYFTGTVAQQVGAVVAGQYPSR